MIELFRKYHALGRAWIGFGVGVIIGDLITALISAVSGDGSILFIPQLQIMAGSEVGAFLWQFCLCGGLGLLFAEAGILFVVDRWSFPIKCLLHFGITAPFYLAFLWFCNFGQDPIPGILIVLGNVLFTYFITWVISYSLTRAEVASINRRIECMKGEANAGNSNGTFD